MIKFLERHRFISFIFLILIGIEIYYISSLSFGPGAGGIEIIPITYHFTIFFLLNTFLLTTIKGKNKINLSYILTVLIISIAYSFLDEFHQSFVPGRVAGLFDILVDSLGIMFSTMIYLKKEKNSNKARQLTRLFSEEEYENEHGVQTDPQKESYY